MKRIMIGAIIFLLAFIAVAQAEISIKAEVNKTTISMGQVLTYKLTVSSTDKQLPRPELPKFDGFSLVSQSQVSNISLLKNNLKTQVVYEFILRPVNPGIFNLGPATLKIKKQTLVTDSFIIEVKPGKKKPKIKPPEQPSLPEELSQETPQVTL